VVVSGSRLNDQMKTKSHTLPRDQARNAATLPDGHLKLIGRIVVDFASLEGAVALTIWSMIHLDSSRGHIVTAELSFKNMLALASSLFLHQSKDTVAIDGMKALIKRTIQVEEKRNLLVHSSWGMQVRRDGRQAVIRMKTTAKLSKGFKRQREELTVEYLECVIDEVIESIKGWSDFLYRYLMPGSPIDPPYSGTGWGKRGSQ